MKKFKTFVKENALEITYFVLGASALVTTAIVARKATKNYNEYMDNVIITTHPDGSFTVSEKPTQ